MEKSTAPVNFLFSIFSQTKYSSFTTKEIINFDGFPLFQTWLNYGVSFLDERNSL